LGVGGDYYDFIELQDGSVGIGIGDFSGKGIPAALLMAGLQASLRGQTIGGADDEPEPPGLQCKPVESVRDFFLRPIQSCNTSIVRT
jgi:hypothetical protein